MAVGSWELNKADHPACIVIVGNYNWLSRHIQVKIVPVSNVTARSGTETALA